MATGVPAFCKAGATGRLLIEVQAELLGRWALLGYQVGPPDGYSGVPAMSRAAPARPLRLVVSPWSRRRWRSPDRVPTKSRPPRWSVPAGIAGGLSFRRRQPWVRFRALGVLPPRPLVLESAGGLLNAGSGGCTTELVAIRCSHAVRRRRCRASNSWHSWQVLPSFPSGSSILSLPHSQVRSKPKPR